MYLRFKNYH